MSLYSNISMPLSSIYTAVTVSGNVPCKTVNHTGWVAVVGSVHNRCVNELFCGVVFVVTLPF